MIQRVVLQPRLQVNFAIRSYAIYKMVGYVGFEPTTSSIQMRRASQATLIPDKVELLDGLEPSFRAYETRASPSMLKEH